MTFLIVVYSLFWLIIFAYLLKINQSNKDIKERLELVLEELEEN